VLEAVLGGAVGLVSSTAFVLVLFVGFCVGFGLVKLRATTGRGRIVRSLDEVLSHQSVRYLLPTDPRHAVDQLHSPELREADVRPS